MYTLIEYSTVYSVWVSLSLHRPCLGPNHGGKREGEVSVFEMFWVLMVQGDDLRVCQYIYVRNSCVSAC